MNKILLSSALAVLLLTGCSEEKKPTSEVTTKVETQKVETIKNEVAKATDATKEVAQTVSNETKEATTTAIEVVNKTVDNTVEVVKETAENVVKATETAVEDTATKVEEAKETTKEIAVNVVTEVKESATTAAEEAKKMITTEVENTTTKVEEVTTEAAAVVAGLDGEALYKSCAACHGLKGEKPALGKSEVIAGWSKEKTINALNGYKDGTYGGVMKNIMKGQVATKTDLEIEALAVFISKM